MVNCAGSGGGLVFEFPLCPFTVLSFEFLKCKMAIMIVSTNRIMCSKSYFIIAQPNGVLH